MTSKARNLADLLSDGFVGTDEIADNAITASKILNNAVTTDKVAGSAITAAKLAAGATVRQFVIATQTSNFATTSNSFVDFLTCPITLASANSRVLVAGVVLGGGTEHGGSRVTRNGTVVPYSGVPGRGNASKSITSSTFTNSFGNNAIIGGGFMFLDSPGQVSNTYILQVASSFGGTTNIGFNTSGNTGYFDAINYFVVVELA
jgi:hypothetical protein